MALDALNDDASLFLRLTPSYEIMRLLIIKPQEWYIYFVTNTKVVGCNQLTLKLFIIDVKDD